MKIRILMLSVLVATLSACSSDSIGNDEFNQVNLKASKKEVKRPFKATVAGTYNISFVGFNAELECGPLALNATAEGNATHLGRTAFIEDWCWNGSPLPADIGVRSRTLIAANGDELYGTVDEILWTSDVTFEEQLIIDGGSGRFSGAKGEFRSFVEIVPIDGFGGTFTSYDTGYISY